MAFPQVATTAVSGAVGGTSTFSATMPTGIVAGDLLLAWSYRPDVSDWTDPSGWTRVGSQSGNAQRSWVWAKVAAGGDGLAIDRSALATEAAVTIYRITGWVGTIASVEAAFLVDFGGAGDPPSLTASWGSADNLWIAACGRAGQNITSYPTNYTANQIVAFNDGVYGAAAIASREVAAATENPGTGFSTGGGTVHVATIVVRGTASGTAPTVTTQPSAQTVTAPATATFTAAFSGSPTPTYQWERQPPAGAYAPISGATLASYTTPATTVTGGSANNGDTYRCVATNASGSATTNGALLTVNAPAGGVTFSGTVPTKNGTVGTAFNFGSPALSTYFTGAGTYSLLAGALPGGLTLDANTGVISGTPTVAGTSAGIVIRKTATSGSPATADTNGFSIVITAGPATTATLLLTTDGVTPAANLSGVKFAFFDEVTPDLWTAPKLKGSNGSTNSSGVMTLNITGVTGLVAGQTGSVAVTNSDGTPAQGSTLRFSFRCLTVS